MSLSTHRGSDLLTVLIRSSQQLHLESGLRRYESTEQRCDLCLLSLLITPLSVSSSVALKHEAKTGGSKNRSGLVSEFHHWYDSVWLTEGIVHIFSLWLSHYSSVIQMRYDASPKNIHGFLRSEGIYMLVDLNCIVFGYLFLQTHRLLYVHLEI